MPRRSPPPRRPSTVAALRLVAAASLLAACAPRAERPDEKQEPSEPPAPVIPTASDLPGRALPTDGSTVAPPLSLTASDGTGLRLVSLDARASVQEPLAFTELHLKFENPQSRTIEGRFTIDLPPGAAISRFAMKIGGQWQEGEVVERQAARVAYEDFLHRKQDPALMEKQAGNRFSARVFPIPANGHKEIIVSYSQELPSSAEPYQMLLAGLPKLDQLDARIFIDEPQPATAGATSIGGTEVSHRSIEVHEKNYIPEANLEVTAHGPAQAMGIRNDDLALARVTIDGDIPPDPITDLTILFDTSASRSLDFGGQVQRLGELVDALRQQEGSFRLRVAAFDQDMSLLFDGDVAEFGEAQLQALFSRRALGASDLASALRRVSTITGPSGRVLLMTDGVSTAGEATGEVLEATRDLKRVGVTRVDAIIDGGLRDEDTLEEITTAGLPHDGIVADARLSASRLAKKLRLATLSDVEIKVPEAQWVWPRVVDGVQPGDEVLVYAQLPADAAMTVVMEGPSTIEAEVPLRPVDRPLLHRAWVGARVDALQLQHAKLDPERDAKSRQRLKDEIVEMSTKHRVVSDFTALLVLETEYDYQRFNIDRNALADILVVGGSGLEWLRRSDGTLAPSEKEGLYAMKGPSNAVPQMARNFDPDRMQRVDPDSWARAAGIMGALQQESGHFLASPYGAAFAVGNDDEDVWGGLTGTEVGEAFGVGGLGLVGTGRGGGGVGEGQIGLGNTGLIGRGGGGGTASGYGRGAGAGFGGRGRRIPRVRQAKAKVKGALDKDIIRRIVRAHINEVRYCYNQGLARDPNLKGRVAIQFNIGPTGKVPVAVVAQTSLKDKNVSNCIAKAVKRWKFPKPKGSMVEVTYPFVLEPGGGYIPPPRPLTAEERAEQRRLQKIQEEQRKERARLQAIEDQRRQAEWERQQAEAQRTKGSPYEGRMFDVMTALEHGQQDQALLLALQWKDDAPGDVLAHLALGEVLQSQGKVKAAARAYGSLIDLFPARADLRRHAGSRLESLGGGALKMAVDTYAKAVEQRPDHPASHRLLGYALARSGEYARAFDAAVTGAAQDYPSGRFAGAKQILREDAGLIAATWIHAQPEQRGEIERRARQADITIPTGPSTRFVMTWETDSNDVDFHIRDAKNGHAYYGNRKLPSGGRLYEDVTTGYGPECFTIEGEPTSFPYVFNAHYFARGPMGYGMGTLQIVEYDGEGGLYFDDRPYVIMKDRAEVKLGELSGPLSHKAQ